MSQPRAHHQPWPARTFATGVHYTRRLWRLDRRDAVLFGDRDCLKCAGHSEMARVKNGPALAGHGLDRPTEARWHEELDGRQRRSIYNIFIERWSPNIGAFKLITVKLTIAHQEENRP